MSASTDSANTETASVTVKAELTGATVIVNPDEDHHTVDLSLTDEQLVELIHKDHEACRKHSRSGGIFIRLNPSVILLIKYKRYVIIVIITTVKPCMLMHICFLLPEKT